MINVYDEEEPKDEKYNPKGHGYVPRVMFFAPDGTLLDRFWSGHTKHMFFYRSAQQVIKTYVGTDASRTMFRQVMVAMSWLLPPCNHTQLNTH